MKNKPHSVDLIYDTDDETLNINDRESSAGQDTINIANEIFEALVSSGYKVKIFPITNHNFTKILKTLDGDIVFNQVEEDVLGFKVLKELEKLGKPVTGIGSIGYKISWQKDKVKKILAKENIPTPKYFITNPEKKLNTKSLSYPLFVKAADDHGSLSITNNSYVTNENELIRQIKWIKETIGGNSLVEEHIKGRELGVTILGNDNNSIVLPIKETVFSKNKISRTNIITYDTKWKENSKDWNTTKDICPAKLKPIEVRAIEKVVLDASRALYARDYTRFDVILADKPYIIDYNPNPGIGMNYNATTLSAKVYGLSYPEFISKIVEVAWQRY